MRRETLRLAILLGAVLLPAFFTATAQARHGGGYHPYPGIGTRYGDGTTWWGPFYRAGDRHRGYYGGGYGHHGRHGGYGGGYGGCHTGCYSSCNVCTTSCVATWEYPVYTAPSCGSYCGAPTYGLAWYPAAVQALPPTTPMKLKHFPVPSKATPPLNVPADLNIVPSRRLPPGPVPPATDVPTVPELKSDLKDAGPDKGTSRPRPSSDQLIARLAGVVSAESARQLRGGEIVPPGTVQPAKSAVATTAVAAK